ncbi:MAG: glycosyltransferase [Myxococcales bacterium]|nr:glycosyltransferase [Myxococcales bacterium]
MRGDPPPSRLPSEVPDGVESRLDALLTAQRSIRDEYERQVAHLEGTIDALKARQRWMERSRSWTLTRPLRVMTEAARLLTTRRGSLVDIGKGAVERLPRQGLPRTSSWIREQVRRLQFSPQHVARLDEILRQYEGRPIVVTHRGVDWNVPLFQRPQQLARALASAGFLFFFVTENRRFDAVDGFVEVEPGCFVTNQNELLLSADLRRIIYLCSTSFSATPETLDEVSQRGDRLVYEYIDEIHEDLSGPIPASLWARHRQALADESVVCVATADSLLAEVSLARRRNFGLVTNGVDAEHFVRRERAPHPLMLPVLARGRPIVGYYGALANWFDYELVRDVARLLPEYEFVLIGPNYDQTGLQTTLHQEPNVTLLGAVPYGELPSAAQSFDVAIIPFKLNAVTASTSPIKVFEYMALGLPMVTTDMPECRKYQSVQIGRGPADFASRVRHAATLRSNPEYLALLARDAAQNTWAVKASQLEALMTTAWGVRPPQGR